MMAKQYIPFGVAIEGYLKNEIGGRNYYCLKKETTPCY